jgi:FkbM family methyltransferase
MSSIVLPWGLALRCRSDQLISYSLHTAGIYDLRLTELLWRSIEPGETAVDAGANVGYVTGLMTALIGPSGQVHAYEPHPENFRQLAANVEGWRRPGAPPITIYELALSNCKGVAHLNEPTGFDSNSGLAKISKIGSGKALEVRTARLDEMMPIDSAIGILKIDVEGHELAVLEGAEALLRGKRIRDVIFEEFSSYPAATHRLLEGLGYTTFHIEQSLFGPLLRMTLPGFAPPVGHPPNYLATLEPSRARVRFRSRGWKCL